MDALMRTFALAVSFLLLQSGALRADPFDRCTNPVLAKIAGTDCAREIPKLTPKLIVDHDRVLKNTIGALIIVRTNEGRWCKLLVVAARMKVGADDKTVPVFQIDRYVTYKDGEERAMWSHGENVCLFGGFRMNLDMGQVVPADVPADLRVAADGDKLHLEVLDKAKMYLLTKAPPDIEPKKADKPEVGDTFETRFINGTYQLHDDGRRAGRLTLKVDEEGNITGTYFSDKGGDKYDVAGKVGTAKHTFQFTIKYRMAEQTFQATMFTGNAKAMAGTARMESRDTAFYAVRVEDE